MVEQMYDTRYYDADKKPSPNIVKFYKKPAAKPGSDETGETEYYMREHIEIVIPGDKTTLIRRGVKEQDKVTYAKQYEAFKKGEEQNPDGYPLTLWPICTEAEQMVLKAHGIQTVEQLAQVPPDMLPKGPEILKLHGKAQEFMDVRESSIEINKLQHKNKELEDQMSNQESTIAALKSQLDQLMAAQEANKDISPKRGRPRKSE